MESEKQISSAVIRRLPRYYRYLGDLLDNDVDRISSKELSIKMNVTASQIRQDLNNFGCFGQQGYGYHVETLYKEIQGILGLNQKHNIIVIGAGNIGQSLVNYSNFEKRGFYFKAIFDLNPRLIGLKIRDVEILDIATLETYLAENHVDIAVLALSKKNAPKVAEKIIKSGVRGVWNFSHIDINAPAGVKVENVHLTDSLMTLSYRLNKNNPDYVG